MKILPGIPVLKSDRLLFQNSNQEILQSILKEGDFLSALLDVHIPDPWTEFGHEPFKYALEKMTASPEEAIWWNWLPILVSENTLIGNCGYKGPPVNGLIEIGYEVAVAYRHQGFATEIAKSLVENAFGHPDVHSIIAHTLPEENDSVRVLQKCGFRLVTPVEYPDDGLIWRWQLDKG